MHLLNKISKIKMKNQEKKKPKKTDIFQKQEPDPSVQMDNFPDLPKDENTPEDKDTNEQGKSHESQSLFTARETDETKGPAVISDAVSHSFNATEKIKGNQWEDAAVGEQQVMTEARPKEEVPSQESMNEDAFAEYYIQNGFHLDDIQNVQFSWTKLKNTFGDQKVATVLYKNIFKMAPHALDLFHFKDETDMYMSLRFVNHGITVTHAIDSVVNGLHNVKGLEPTLKELGLYHIRKGIKPDTFPIVEKALINTLKAGLKKEFTHNMAASWQEVFKVVFKVMKSDFLTNGDILIEALTSHKIRLIRESWAKASAAGPVVVGTLIYTNLFELNPDLFKLFSFSKFKDFKNSPRFQEHLTVIFGALNKIVDNLESIDHLMEIMRQIGDDHLDKGVKKDDYQTMITAIGKTLEMALGNELDFETKMAWKLLLNRIRDGCISDNYDQMQVAEEMYKNHGVTKEEHEMVINLWRRAVKLSSEPVGFIMFKNLFQMYPELVRKFGFSSKLGSDLDKAIGHHAETATKQLTNCIAIFQKFPILFLECKKVRESHMKIGLNRQYFVLMREATLQMFEDVFNEELPNDKKWAIVKIFNTIRNLILGFNPDQIPDDTQKINQIYWRILLQSWKKLKRYDKDVSGPLIYKNLFQLYPGALNFFSFKNQKNYIQSNIVKKQTSSVVGVIGRTIEALDEFDKIETILKTIGHEHISRHITRSEYSAIIHALFVTIEQVDGPHWDNTVKRAWEIALHIITEKMLEPETFDHKKFIDLEKPAHHINFLATPHKDDNEYSGRDTSSFRPLNGKDQMETTKHTMHEATRTEFSKNMLNFYSSHFQHEVDFHHKVAYRFEKAYRLSKKAGTRQQTLNLEVIECISEYFNYIEQDNMTLFYLLFFCIYYKNQVIVDFIRTLILKVDPNPKISQLLEIIDTHGIDKIRSVGEQVNSHVYHMVFYQAMDDNLRIVYSSIFKQLRMIQLRDSDALCLLYNRDYELIKMSFEKHIAKLSLEQFGYSKDVSIKCHSYRKYNQAYFEEIVINYEVEARVALNYRERFLVTPEDINIVFEMYCKEDYDMQFIQTKKSDVTKKQFLNLFVICIKSDAVKIAMLIYLLYIDPITDIDEKMMDVIIGSIRESLRFHEIKLFFIHEHFDVLSIQQLTVLIDIYHTSLHSQDYKNHPIVNQYNTIKVALLIYRICWKIEQKQIYSLITKCTLLEDYLITGMSRYLEKQSNILIIQRFMLEPIFHMSERNDCLDIMYQMNMSRLLKHPIIVEVLNLVNEGQYSTSGNSFSVSQTYICLTDMGTFHAKSLKSRLWANILEFGAKSRQRQTCLQYNIWKQSINQRQFDELFLTIMFTCFMILISIVQMISINTLHANEVETLGGSTIVKPELILQADPSVLKQFCALTLQDYLQVHNTLTFFQGASYVYTVGMLASVVQKVVILRFKDNVSLNMFQLFIEIFGVATGTMFIVIVSQSEKSGDLSRECAKHISITEEESLKLDKVQGLLASIIHNNGINFQFIMSAFIVQLVSITIVILQRSNYSGEMITMLVAILEQLGMFFITFGSLIVLFIIFGRFLEMEILTNEDGLDKENEYFRMFLDLLNTFVGKPSFESFVFPFGSIFNMVFLLLFKVILLSLLTAMIINRYHRMYSQLQAIKRYEFIRLKNTIKYNQNIGAITCSFFPINCLCLPFVFPVLYNQSVRVSDFLLKLQYSLMIFIYALLAGFMAILFFPLMYFKLVLNALYIAVKNQRVSYRGENLVELLIAVTLGPAIIGGSLLVDILNLPNVLFQDSSTFELKYPNQDNQLTRIQQDQVYSIFNKMFFGLNFVKHKDKHLTLIDLMVMHRSLFKMVENLHDLVCRGLKDYRQALHIVLEYNLTKIMTRRCSVPDPDGELKNSRVEMNVLFCVANDIEIYNSIDIVLRRYRMQKLVTYISDHELGRKTEDEEIAQMPEGRKVGKREQNARTVVTDDTVTPDGQPLRRQFLDFLSNYWVNQVVRSFTDIEEILQKVNQSEKRQQQKFQERLLEIQDNQIDSIINDFENSCQRFFKVANYHFTRKDGSTIQKKKIQFQAEQKPENENQLKPDLNLYEMRRRKMSIMKPDVGTSMRNLHAAKKQQTLFAKKKQQQQID